MSDETLDPGVTAGLQDLRPADPDGPAPEEVGTIADQDDHGRTADPDGPAPEEVGTIADQDDHPRLHDVPGTLLGTVTGPPSVARTVPPGTRRTDAGAAVDAMTQGDAVPPGAFDQTEAATGVSVRPNEGNHGTLLAETLLPSGADAWSDEDYDRLKRRCGNYVLKQFYAKGGMGEVWLAEDPVIGRSVALKRMLSKDAQHATRFRVEAQVTGKLEHPGIVPVH